MDSPYLLLLLLIPLVPLLFLLVLCFLVRPKSVKIPIKKRHVFITGGSSGIGLCIARQAAAEGARVSILARNLAKLEEARDIIRLATGVEVGIFSADVRDAEAVARAVEEAGPVDVLVCNQGIFTPKELELQDISEIRLMMEVNVMGTFHMIKAALPAMKRRVKETGVPASIALVSSQAGQVRFLKHRLRPETTTLIAGSEGSAMKADDVAKISLNGIKSGAFIVPCGFEGTMLAIATAGLSPQPSSLGAFIEVLGAGLMRFLGLCFQWNWYSIIQKCHAKKNKK
ncbi:uncharacterized protein A4U43_C04F10550 [Asparagus officinalis]|uniref:Uncharacterized protein n=1 Tax=Asparagus officinalis TaxID=4686 RepID=A0A5P1F4B6_ASPOF|nr:uncharacterized protein A4U43_C04F10550 [Asparagus officinalis]